MELQYWINDSCTLMFHRLAFEWEIGYEKPKYLDVKSKIKIKFEIVITCYKPKAELKL